MLCEKPFMNGNIPISCGDCDSCRRRRRRIWQHRMLLESQLHAENSFLTLTYSDDCLPKDGSLVKSDAQKFIKRLREAYRVFTESHSLTSNGVRYYLVGEYGDETHRPHYHACLFGIGPELVDLVTSCWSFGHIYLAEFNKDTAAYVAGYVTKKLTKREDPRLVSTDENGSTVYLQPEFSLMSRKPGLGAGAMRNVADALFTDHGAALIEELGDVPRALMHGTKLMPLDRYLRRKLRDEIGMPQPKPVTEMSLDEFLSSPLSDYSKELQALQITHLTDAKKKEAATSLKQIVLNENKQKRRNAAAKNKLFKQRKTL